MAKDPAFLFYPGDYLRDTQCLSEKTQVAYDRIMCEHMRNTSVDMNNITISQDKVNFFTKRLSEDEKQELFTVLEKKGDGYQIYWVAESIADRRMYSESRSKNRSKNKESHENTSKHMEDGIEIEIKYEGDKKVEEKFLIPDMFKVFKEALPKYPGFIEKDFKPLKSIADFLHQQSGLNGSILTNHKIILSEWKNLCTTISGDKFYKLKTLSTISNHIQEIYQINKDGTGTNKSSIKHSGKSAGAYELLDKIKGQTNGGRK